MREAVIVSTARTPIGKAYRGAFNNTDGATLGGHAIAEAVKRSGIDPADIDDISMGCALQQGTTGTNIARQAALRAGLPVTEVKASQVISLPMHAYLEPDDQDLVIAAVRAFVKKNAS